VGIVGTLLVLFMMIHLMWGATYITNVKVKSKMDTILRGSIIGFIATIPYIMVSWVLYMLGISPSTVIHYGAILITSPGTAITTLTLLLGLLAVTISGTFMGNILAFLLNWTGSDYALLKSTGLGVVLWIVHSKVLPSLIEPKLFKVLPPSMVLQALIVAGIWGIVAGYSYLSLEKRSN